MCFFVFFEFVANVTKVCVKYQFVVAFLTTLSSCMLEYIAFSVVFYILKLMHLQSKKKPSFAIFNKKKFIFVFC